MKILAYNVTSIKIRTKYNFYSRPSSRPYFEKILVTLELSLIQYRLISNKNLSFSKINYRTGYPIFNIYNLFFEIEIKREF